MGTSEGARKGWTPESRAKRAEAMRRKWADPEYRARRAVTEADPDVKARRSAASKKANADPVKRARHSEIIKQKFATDSEYRQKHAAGLHRAMVDNPSSNQARSETMKRAWAEMRGNLQNSIANSPSKVLTGIELAVHAALNDLDITYQVNKRVDRWQLDVYVPEWELNVEVDGSYWHSLPGRAEHDTVRDKALNELGITVIRISENEIYDGSFVDFLEDIFAQE